jgi:hypothetical protein
MGVAFYTEMHRRISRLPPVYYHDPAYQAESFYVSA